MNTSDVTAIIPVRIDSSERLRNLQTSVDFLLRFFDFKIIIKEVDVVQNVFFENTDRVKYIFEFSENDYFHRTKILNDMLKIVDTKYTVNYDCDVLLPQSNCYEALELLNAGHDLVYPYKKGMFLSSWNFKQEDLSKFLSESNTNNLSFFLNRFQFNPSQPGLDVFKKLNIGTIHSIGCIQFFNTESYKKGFGENELFIDWGPEDQERLYRFYILGYKIGWIKNGSICHMAHPPSKSTDKNTTHNIKNHELYNWIVDNLKSKEQMLDYMNNLDYVKQLK
jgi:hypothetical protein